METEALGRREQRKIETRRALLDAAYRLFADRGYHETTMEDVADAAGVSRRTAFRYFATKDSLVFPERERRLARFRELLRAETAAEDPYDAVRGAVLELAVEYGEEPGYLLAQDRLVRATPELAGLELQLDKDFEGAMVERLLGSKRSKSARRRARVLAAAVMGVIRAALREWFDGACSADLVQLGEDSFQVLESGVRE